MGNNINLKAVALTSKYVMSKTSPVIYVTLHEDGVWEFWGKEIIEEKEIVVISLGQMLEKDPTLNKVLGLQVGYYATRNSATDEWAIFLKNQQE